MSKYTKSQITEATEELRNLCPPGSTVYTVLRHVSRSGMMRHIDLYIMQDCEPRRISYMAAQALEMPTTNSGALKVGGCGMDMGFSAVYSLSSVLWRGNFTCTGEGCRSNDHYNGDRDYTPHAHSDGGYALYHRWM